MNIIFIMSDLINYTAGTSIMFTTFGLFRALTLMSDIDRCAGVNLKAGLSLGFISGGLIVRNAFRS